MTAQRQAVTHMHEHTGPTRNHKCPHCGASMGIEPYPHCPQCGKKTSGKHDLSGGPPQWVPQTRSTRHEDDPGRHGKGSAPQLFDELSPYVPTHEIHDPNSGVGDIVTRDDYLPRSMREHRHDLPRGASRHDYDPDNPNQEFAPARGHGWEHASGPSGPPYERPQSEHGHHEAGRHEKPPTHVVPMGDEEYESYINQDPDYSGGAHETWSIPQVSQHQPTHEESAGFRPDRPIIDPSIAEEVAARPKRRRGRALHAHENECMHCGGRIEEDLDNKEFVHMRNGKPYHPGHLAEPNYEPGDPLYGGHEASRRQACWPGCHENEEHVRKYHKKKEGQRKTSWSGWGPAVFPKHRQVTGWNWDNHLNGYIANRPQRFACECGNDFETPTGFRRCKCGKQWNSYTVGQIGPNHTASADLFIVREIPIRPDVIVASENSDKKLRDQWAVGLAAPPDKYPDLDKPRKPRVHLDPETGKPAKPGTVWAKKVILTDPKTGKRYEMVDPMAEGEDDWPSDHHPETGKLKSTPDDWWRRDQNQRWVKGGGPRG